VRNGTSRRAGGWRAQELARERVARVVFADALAMLDGEALTDIVKRPTSSTPN